MQNRNNQKVFNSQTGRYVNSNGKKGRHILELYSQYGGKPILRQYRPEQDLVQAEQPFIPEDIGIWDQNGNPEHWQAPGDEEDIDLNDEDIAELAEAYAAHINDMPHEVDDIDHDRILEERNVAVNRIREQEQNAIPILQRLLEQEEPGDSELLITILNIAREVNGWDYSDLIDEEGIVDRHANMLNYRVLVDIINAQKPTNVTIIDYLANLRAQIHGV